MLSGDHFSSVCQEISSRLRPSHRPCPERHLFGSRGEALRARSPRFGSWSWLDETGSWAPGSWLLDDWVCSYVILCWYLNGPFFWGRFFATPKLSQGHIPLSLEPWQVGTQNSSRMSAVKLWRRAHLCGGRWEQPGKCRNSEQDKHIGTCGKCRTYGSTDLYVILKLWSYFIQYEVPFPKSFQRW